MGREDDKSLNYIGIVRLTDRCLLASHPDAPPKESRKEVSKVLYIDPITVRQDLQGLG